MRRLRPWPLVAVALVAGACGAQTATDGDVAATTESTGPRTVRLERVTRLDAADGAHEFRSSEVVDYERERRLSVDEKTGCRTISIGETTYAEVPGAQWVRHDGSGEAAEALFERGRTKTETGWTSYALIVGTEGPDSDPAGALDYLRAHGDPRAVGSDVLRGVPTTRYRATVDVRSATRSALEDAGWEAANIERYLEQVSVPTEEVEVWVDDAGTAHRVVTRTRLDGAGGLGPLETVTTVDYVEFGARAEIEPPAGEFLDWPDELPADADSGVTSCRG